ncbi:MAG TPA: hypothetical protein ENJ95_22245 [Bacteroidetes bacterium]|nr:hypothetical protein [Bacteroidota bacterium]
MWLHGFNATLESPPPFGITILDFNHRPVLLSRETQNMGFPDASFSMSDKEGQLIFKTNGLEIFTAGDELMENGADLDEGLFVFPQGAFALPWPGRDSLYCLIHEKTAFEDNTAYVSEFLYSLVDMRENNGAGAVTEKNVPLMEGAFYYHTAVRHGNGRDWWIVAPDAYEAAYYVLLLTPEGFEGPYIQEFDFPLDTIKIRSQKIFSPDGSLYVDFDSWNGIRVFPFDRCTGELGEPRNVPFGFGAPFPFPGWGAAISPNSRFLYTCTNTLLMQYDLWSSNIADSADTVGIFDDFQTPFSSTFYFMQLAPDGRIYICATNGENMYHVINNPNAKGTACEFLPHGLVTPTLTYIHIPYFPNYRLYDLPDSPCDSLGIDGYIPKNEQEK